MGERPLHRDESHSVPVYRESRTPRDSVCQGRRLDRAGLKRRNLGEVEHVMHVDARARDLDAAEAVDREISKRVRGRRGRQKECYERGSENDETLHGRRQ
jgi:hypothetical protein